MDIARKVLRVPVEIRKADSPDYDARFVMSASSPDRIKDTIDPAAYKPWAGKSLIALWQHETAQPFGVWTNLQAKAAQLVGDLKIAGTNLGSMIKALIDAGVPLGASIGFRGTGEPNKIGGIHFDAIDLLECSIVSVPMHPAALQISKNFGLLLPSSQQEPPANSGRSAEVLAAAQDTIKRIATMRAQP